MLAGGEWRIAQAGPDALQCFAESAGGLTVEADQKSIRVFGLEFVGGECGRRKILDVCGQDDVRFTAYGRSDDMTIVGIRETNGGQEVFEARNQGVPYVGIHESASAPEAAWRNVRPATQQRADPLIVDGVGPFGAVEVRYGEFEQEIAQRRRV